MRWQRRGAQWESVAHAAFDVAIVGGGINGASIYHQLCREGYRVLLVDQGDFGGGTSQASAMFIWGGLLYLRNLQIGSVARFCHARDRMVRDLGEWVRVRTIRYMPSREDRRRPEAILAGLCLYWLLGACRRHVPWAQGKYPERALFKPERLHHSVLYEEACVAPSDARFVLQWILAHQGPEQVALNYCALEGGAYEPSDRTWRLELVDRLGGKQAVARARLVVNAAGVWTDEINRRFGVETAFKHVFSKGVFIGIARDPRLSIPLIFETRRDADCVSLIPWGPVALWGPTETLTGDLAAGFRVELEDVRFLLDELNRHLVRPVGPSDIVSLRCGVRPLAVRRSSVPGRHTLDLSRDLHVDRARDVPWISVYGGKITGCVPAAQAVARLVGETVRPVAGRAAPPAATDPPRLEWEAVPSLAGPVPSPRYCAEHEACWALEDYLRRRTNIAQWVARCGLGRNDEYVPHLRELARVFTDGGETAAQEAVDAYRTRVQRDFDSVLNACEGARA